MASLNQYASRVAHIVGQPDNHSLKERIKDMIKDYFAKYLIQSIDRNGIQPYYKLVLKVECVGVEETKVINPIYDNNFYYIDGVRQYNDDGTPKENPRKYTYVDYKTTTKIPKPLNIKSDAPFTRVSISGTARDFAYSSNLNYTISHTLPPTRIRSKYKYEGDVITCKRISPIGTPSETPIEYIDIETIWENPEEIIGYYGQTDNQDLDLPFPNEMFNLVLADLLKLEFGIVPQDTEIIKK